MSSPITHCLTVFLSWSDLTVTKLAMDFVPVLLLLGYIKLLCPKETICITTVSKSSFSCDIQKTVIQLR